MAIQTRDAIDGSHRLSVWPVEPDAVKPRSVLRTSERAWIAWFSPNGKQLFTARDKNGKSVLWDVESGDAIANFDTRDYVGVEFAPDGKSFLLTSGVHCREFDIAAVDAFSGAIHWSRNFSSGLDYLEPKFDARGSTVSVFGVFEAKFGALRFLDSATGENKADLGDNASSSGIVFTPDRQRMAAQFVHWDVVDNEDSFFDLVLIWMRLKVRRPVDALPILSSWSTIAVADPTTAHVLFRVNSDKCLNVLLSDDGRTAVIDEVDRITCWDVPTRFDIGSMVATIVVLWLVLLVAGRTLAHFRNRASRSAASSK
jgi:WD40 repeat protein